MLTTDQLTDEQRLVVERFLAGRSLVANAYAGTGKTSVLEVAARNRSGKGLYTAFGHNDVKEAKQRFPQHVLARTPHSLAMKALGRTYGNRVGRVTGTQLMHELGLPPISAFNDAATGGLVLDTLRNFCYSADTEITRAHAPYGELARRFSARDDQEALAAELAPRARRAWAAMEAINGDLPVTLDFILKKWGLTNPTLGVDWILFDEYQDANPVMADLVARQGVQVVLTGDAFQQIYAWRGAVNAMSRVPVDERLELTKSFRFGPAIAHVANAVLQDFLGVDAGIRGNPDIPSGLKPVFRPDAVLARTNASLVETILQRMKGKRPQSVYVAGGSDQIAGLLRGAKDLIRGKGTSQKDLAIFNTWQEVVDTARTPAGGDLKPLVRMVERYDIDKLITTLEDCPDSPRQAGLTVTTVHKAKGREWPSVQLTGDFRGPQDNSFNSDEVNLLYVAATRAQRTLDTLACKPLNEVLADNPPPDSTAGF